MEQKQRIEVTEKIKIVQAHLAGEIGVREAARVVGVTDASIRCWIRLYKAEGLEGFIRQTNRVYSVSEKRAAVEDYLRGGISIQDICAKYKISDTHVFRRWLKVYNAHGDFNSVKHSGGGSYMKKARSTSQEERLQIVKDCLKSGRNYGEMALKYNVSYQQVRTWTLRFEELGEAGLEDRRGKRKKDQTPRTELEAAQIEIENLKHKLYMAEMENHLLKKLDEIVRRDALDK